MNKFLFLVIFLLAMVSFIFNPLSLALGLILFSCLVGVNLYFSISVWAMNSIVLIFLGGMMVLILYMVTLSNSEKVVFPNPKKIWGVVLILLCPSSELVSTNSYYSGFLDYFDLFKMSHLHILWFLVFYLLLSLFSVVKFSESFKGTLVKTKFL